MNKLLLYILALWPFAGWAQGHFPSYYFNQKTSSIDSLVERCSEFLALSGHTYRYVKKEQGYYGEKYLVFAREEKYWDGSTVWARVFYSETPVYDLKDGETMPIDSPSYWLYSQWTYISEYEDMHAIWSKYIDPEHSDREKLLEYLSYGGGRGPGHSLLGDPGVYRYPKDSTGTLWTFKFTVEDFVPERTYCTRYGISGGYKYTPGEYRRDG